MADAWVAAGHEVTVVTNFPNHPTGVLYPGYRRSAFLEEQVDGIRILRCRTYITPNRGFVRKVFSHLYFALNAFLQGRSRVGRPDLLLVSSPPLFTGLGVWALSRSLRCPYILEVRDLWPAIFVELGVLRNRLIIALLERLELFLYRRSRHVVTVTRAFADDIADRGFPRERLSFIPNGVDLRRFSPGAGSAAVRREFGVDGKFVVLYLGTHGISQALGSVVEAAASLREEPEIHFLFVGEGADRQALIEQAERLELPNVSFFPGQPKEKVPSLYAIADVCLVPLRDIPLFRAFIPSKMFEVMACEVPLVASVAGEAAEILEASDGGAVICPPEDSERLAQAILELRRDPRRRRSMARRGRRFVVREFDRKRLAHQYLELMEKIVSAA